MLLRNVNTAQRLEANLLRFDRQLVGIERAAIKRYALALHDSRVELEREIKRLMRRADIGTASVGAPIREAQARLLLEQVQVAERLAAGLPAEQVLADLQVQAQTLGSQNAVDALSVYGRTAVTLGGDAQLGRALYGTRISGRLEEIRLARLANGRAALLQHTADAAAKIERAITANMVSSRGWQATAHAIRREVDITLYSAERLVRTESIEASDAARRDTYAEAGATHVRIMVTMDTRLCGWCASRAGKIYKLGDVQLPFHPNCRCYSSPVFAQDITDGITREDWWEAHRKEALEKARKAGHRIRSSPSTSEKWRGLDAAPEPVTLPGART